MGSPGAAVIATPNGGAETTADYALSAEAQHLVSMGATAISGSQYAYATSGTQPSGVGPGW